MQGIGIEIPSPLLEKAARWSSLKRWERRELGQALRRLGLSFREVRSIIPVPNGTLSAWCRDIALSADALKRIDSIRPGEARRAAGYARRRATTLARRQAIRTKARAEAATLAADPLWVAGVVAYWAEGAKRSFDVRFANSDPEMIRVFICWVERFLAASIDDLAAHLHLHSGQDDAFARSFWSERTRIPEAAFVKTFVKKEGTGHRRNILYTGTLSVRARRSSDRLQRILGWIDWLQDPSGPLAQLARAGAS